MTIFININQKKALEWKLTPSESFIIDYLLRVPSWGERITISNQDYYWISRNKVISDLPFVTTKNDTIYRIYKSLSEKGLILYEKIGQKDAIKILPKMQEWNLGIKSDLSEPSESNPNKTESNPKSIGNESEINSEMNPTYSKFNSDSKFNYSKSENKSELEKTFDEYLLMRKAKGKAPTARAIELVKNNLKKLANGSESLAIKILEQSILNSWTDVYPLKSESGKFATQQDKVKEDMNNAFKESFDKIWNE